MRIAFHSCRTAALALAVLAAFGVGGWLYYRHDRAGRDLTAAIDDEAHFRYDAAREHIRRAADYWPDRGDVRLLAARLCRRAGGPDEASAHLDAARRLLGDTPEVRLEQQLIAAQKGEASEFAENALENRARTESGQRALIYEALLAGALAQFRIDRGKAIADAWLAEPTDDPRPWFWRGATEEVIGGTMEDRAVADFRRAVELNPEYDEARLHLGRLLLKKKNWADARPQFEELLRRHPDEANYLVGLGRCQVAAGETDAGRELLDRAIARDPNNVDALRERGMLALNAGRPDEAEPFLRKAYDLLPQDGYTSYNWMICLQRLGRDAEAKQQEARYKELTEQQERLHRLQGEFQQRPKDPDLMYQIGKLYLDTKRAEYQQEGVRWLLRALEVAPNHRPSLAALADYYEHTGRPAAAAQFRRRLQ